MIKPVIIRDKKPKWYKDQKKLTVGIGLFIIFTMVFSIFGYSLGGSNSLGGETNNYKYNDYRFVQTPNGWITHINEAPIEFFFGPQELEHLNPNVNINELNEINIKNIFITTNPEDELDLTINEFRRFIRLIPPVSLACSKNVEGCEDLEIITCENANIETGVIEFKLSNEVGITLNNNCLEIKGTEITTLMLIDRIIYQGLGIMP
tara:strand:- start:52385 stop:53002 length:618 start_codon:yes stop_codon:yes gene_type:complete